MRTLSRENAMLAKWMTRRITVKLLRRCENVHYNLLMGMYFSGQANIGKSTIVWSDTIPDYIWNYGTRIKSKRDSEGTISEVADFLQKKKRKPAFYLTPFCIPVNFFQILESQGYVCKSTDAWMFFRGNPIVQIPYNLKVKRVENKTDMLFFKEVYDAAYSSKNGTYCFPPEYGIAVFNSYDRQETNVTVRNYLVFDNETPVGILSLLSKDGLFGIYNVGTIPSFQKRGIGSTLTNLAISKAIIEGAKAIFLQTEKDSPNESFYKKQGFITYFEAKCLTL